MTYNLPKNLSVISTTAIIDVLTTSTTTIYTFDKDFLLYNIVMKLVQLVGGPTSVSFATMGFNDPIYDNVSPALSFNLTTQGYASVFSSPFSLNLMPASSTLKVVITTPDTAPSVENYQLDLIGYYI